MINSKRCPPQYIDAICYANRLVRGTAQYSYGEKKATLCQCAADLRPLPGGEKGQVRGLWLLFPDTAA